MWVLNEREEATLTNELGRRTTSYLHIENSDWAYKFWWMSGHWWWDAASRSWIKETRSAYLKNLERNP